MEWFKKAETALMPEERCESPAQSAEEVPRALLERHTNEEDTVISMTLHFPETSQTVRA